MKREKWKSLLAGAALFVFALSLVMPANAQVGALSRELVYRNIGVTLDGKALELRDAQGKAVEPFLLDGTTYLPLRAVAGSLGLQVEWDGANSRVILESSPESRWVYITRTGSKYHYDDSCNGGTYWPVPFSTALGMGLEPCAKCVSAAGEPEDSPDEAAYAVVNHNVPFFRPTTGKEVSLKNTAT